MTKRLLVGLLLGQGIPLAILFGCYAASVLLVGRTPEIMEQALLVNSSVGIFSVIIAVLMLLKKYRAVTAMAWVAVVVGTFLMCWFLLKDIGSSLFVFSPYFYLVGFTCVLLQASVLLYVKASVTSSKSETGKIVYTESQASNYQKTTALPLMQVLTFGAVSHLIFGFACFFFTALALAGLLTHPFTDAVAVAELTSDFFIRCLSVFSPLWVGIPILVPALLLQQKKLVSAAVLLVVCTLLAFVPGLMDISFFSSLLIIGAICWIYFIINVALTIRDSLMHQIETKLEEAKEKSQPDEAKLEEAKEKSQPDEAELEDAIEESQSDEAEPVEAIEESQSDEAELEETKEESQL